MKQIQVILTIDVTNDEYSLLLNKNSDLSLLTLVRYLTETEIERLSFDFPALLIDLPSQELTGDHDISSCSHT